MNSRFFVPLLFLSLLLPIGLLLSNLLRSGQAADVAAMQFFAVNWLYLAWPQLLLGVLALIFIPSLLRFGIVALVALDALLVIMHWLITSVHAGDPDSALGWVLYPALSIPILVIAVVCSLISARRERGL